MKNKKILTIIIILSILALLVSAAMKKTSLFFNGDESGDNVSLKNSFQLPLSVCTDGIRTQH